ncbi:MAG: dienelactone hydrolase family protein [Thiotrichaceae bacterium]|nr:dienelactone hydrolase family protein [Thiotrichaceae bacterium]PCI14394.1 MAG: hypothetical protein COB71_03530 [Thiotrichales bacterium]
MLRNCLLMVMCCLWTNAASAEMVTLKTAYGTSFNAYVAGPADAEIGIVIAHDRWGLADEVKVWAERYGKQGFRVVVPDLFDGRPVLRDAMAKMVMAQTDPEWVVANLHGAIDDLKRRQDLVAAIGWGYGAKHLYQIATSHDADIDALVAFYAMPQGNQQALERLDTPILGLFGRRDPAFGIDVLDAFQQTMLKLRKNLDVVTVNAHSGFVNPMSASYNAAASEEAWLAIQRFLKRHFTE